MSARGSPLATEWRESWGSFAALQAVRGHGSITVTERSGTISDDLVEREDQRFVECRSVRGRHKNGTPQHLHQAELVRRDGIEPSTY